MTYDGSDLCITADQVERTIKHRIVAGEYSLGFKMPSIRALSDEMGVNRGVVERAYRSLVGRGVVLSTRSGYYVKSVPQDTIGSDLDSEIGALLTQAVRLAFPLGLSLSDLTHLLTKVYESTSEPAPRVAFVECGRWDVHDLAVKLSTVFGLQFEGYTLEEFPQAYASGNIRVVTTSVYHLAEVEEMVGNDRVIALVLNPDPEDLLHVSRLKSGTRIGIVGPNERTVQLYLNVITPIREVAGWALADRTADVLDLAARVDVIVDNPIAHIAVSQLDLNIPVITVRFRIDPQSLSYLGHYLERHGLQPRVIARSGLQ